MIRFTNVKDKNDRYVLVNVVIGKKNTIGQGLDMLPSLPSMGIATKVYRCP